MYIKRTSDVDSEYPYDYDNKSSILKMSMSVDKALYIIIAQTVVIAALITSTVYFAFNRSTNIEFNNEYVPVSDVQSYFLRDALNNLTLNIIDNLQNQSQSQTSINTNITHNMTHSRYLERKLLI